MGPEVWIGRDDFAEAPPKGFFRLCPGNKVRLKYGLVVECTGCEKDSAGRVTAMLARAVPDTKSGTPGAAAVKVNGYFVTDRIEHRPDSPVFNRIVALKDSWGSK